MPFVHKTAATLAPDQLDTTGLLQVANNLDDVASASTARTNLGLTANLPGYSKHLRANVFNPNMVYTIDTQVILIPKVAAALTFTNVEVKLNTAAQQIDANLKYADDTLTFPNSVVINALDTTSGVLSDSSLTSGAVAAGKCVYIEFDAQPNAAITQVGFDGTFDYDA